jgi:uncharacterized protein YozE (UPF0346 family)
METTKLQNGFKVTFEYLERKGYYIVKLYKFDQVVDTCETSSHLGARGCMRSFISKASI